jgi:hypothetical protein
MGEDLRSWPAHYSFWIERSADNPKRTVDGVGKAIPQAIRENRGVIEER